jgi:hypothetical protein
MDKFVVGDFVSLHGWNGVVVDVFNGTYDEKLGVNSLVYQVCFAKNIAKGQTYEYIDVTLGIHTLELSSKAAMIDEFNKLMNERTAEFTRRVPIT